MPFWFLLKAFTGNVVPDVVEPSLCTDSYGLCSCSITSRPCRPAPSLCAVWVPPTSPEDPSGIETVHSPHVLSVCSHEISLSAWQMWWKFHVLRTRNSPGICLGATSLFVTAWTPKGLDEFHSSGRNNETLSLPYLHSLSPPEYFDPSKWTWTKVLD